MSPSSRETTAGISKAETPAPAIIRPGVPRKIRELPEPFTTTGHTNTGYYWSPNARKVYAIQPGPITDPVAAAVEEFKPDAIVLSGTLRDFDFYQQSIIDSFSEFIRKTNIPVLAICGGHQLVGLSFGARVVTLDKLEQHEQREDRPHEYQYRFIRITDPTDPIFTGMNSVEVNQVAESSQPARILRVWQNHGLQLDRVPDGFHLLATSYLCRNQMMVKRTDGQLIYTVQFHLEKSFEDWNKNRTRWEHPNDSRDGRRLFENFLMLALS